MSDLDLHWAPRQMLQRASNLLTTSGNPVPAFEEVFVESTSENSSSNSSLSTNGFGASIKRTLQGAKDSMPLVRSISLRSRSRSQSHDSHARRQNRAFSTDNSMARPRLVHTNSPESINTVSKVPQGQPIVQSPTLSQSPIAPRRNSMVDVAVPQLLQKGVPMTKVSASRQKTYVFQLEPDQGQIIWESKTLKIIPIENIKELRSTSDARYYREQFQLSQEYEDRWLTIIYIMDGNYKTLHLIASTKEIFQMWDITLRKLYAIRQELMSGLGNVDMRQAVWEKQYWKGADDDKDQKLDFEETERLCKRLNVNSSTDTLLRLFKQADTQNRNYLDFTQFQRFVKMLKARPELDRLYKKICSANQGLFNFNTFRVFMRDSQKSSLDQPELQKIFMKYAASSSSSSAPAVKPHSISPPTESRPTPAASHLPATDAPSTNPLSSAAQTLASTSASSLSSPIESYTLSLDGFTAFLLSAENSAFTDQHGKIWHDMSRPLSDYYISTSHNTYLVGHQLVGVSTIEGYIRALLHGCRSVELDIYDGDKEPVIFHGKTLTTKVALRQVCQAIAKYAFVASPYPIIISAEIHCSLPQQDMMADIMIEVFGDILIRAPIDGLPKIDVLPSPEQLKGKVLLKAKNLYVSASESIRDNSVSVNTESSSTDPSTSEPELVEEAKAEWQKVQAIEGQTVKELKDEFRKARDSETVKDIKEEFTKARQNVISRFTGHKKTPSAVSPTLVGLPTSASMVKSFDKRADRPKVKMSFSVVSLLVYTVGVKCRGINKKERYAPEHVFSLSENTANKILKQGMHDLIKHTRAHVVRIYPKGLRFGSTNYEPHRYWSAGAQLVAINWQTFDLGYMINHSMFQRNGRSGYVLKPLALRTADKELLSKRTKHVLDIQIISAQQLPRLKYSSGREVIDKTVVDPYVEVSIHVPDWTQSPFHSASNDAADYSVPTTHSSTIHKRSLSTSSAKGNNTFISSSSSTVNSTSARTITYRTGIVKNNGFNPVWQEDLHLSFDCVGDMMDLVFVRFAVRHEGSEEEPLAVYCASLGSLQQGYRHLPLHDAQMSQYLFSTLFVDIDIHNA